MPPAAAPSHAAATGAAHNSGISNSTHGIGSSATATTATVAGSVVGSHTAATAATANGTANGGKSVLTAMSTPPVPVGAAGPEPV